MNFLLLAFFVLTLINTIHKTSGFMPAAAAAARTRIAFTNILKPSLSLYTHINSSNRCTSKIAKRSKTASTTAIGSLSSSLEPPTPSSGDDLGKWDKMYNENAKAGALTTGTTEGAAGSQIKSEIRVVTFDLDNTIWKTGNVISSANDALAEYLADSGIHVPIRVEKIMGTLFKANKAKYSPILVKEALQNMNTDTSSSSSVTVLVADAGENESEKEEILNNIKTPVLLTQLRIDALIEVFNNQTEKISLIEEEEENDDDAETQTQTQTLVIQKKALEAFDIWTSARHDAIPNNLASSVIECLDEIRSIKTSYGKSIVVGAITDGNSDPRRVDMLKDYFDFCVNAESVGISKPDRRVYDAALIHVYSNPDLQHVFHDFNGNSESENKNEIDCNILFENIQNKWIHIGDDFLKDIVGAKELRMRSIWSRELVKGKSQPIPKTTEKDMSITTSNSQEDDESSSRLTKALDEKKVVNMIIGSEDFLLDSIQAEFADAIVDEFQDVGRVITQWHLEGIDHLNNNEGNQVLLPPVAGENISQEVADLFTIIVPDDPEVNRITEGISDAQSAQNDETKFCVMCGTKLPKVAKFCSSCGNKQPSMTI